MERLSPILVIDASVSMKWFVPEKDTEKAMKLRARHIEGTIDLVTPDLLLYEVANALRFHPILHIDQVEAALEALFDLNLEIAVFSSELLLKTAKKARDLDITVYDSAYLVLAEDIAGHMVTADDKLYRKTKETGLSRLLTHFEEKWMV